MRLLKGWRLLTGLLSFYASCGLGAIANVGIAAQIFSGAHSCWLAGLSGAAVGSVWNYAISAAFTWRAGAPMRQVRTTPELQPVVSGS